MFQRVHSVLGLIALAVMAAGCGAPAEMQSLWSTEGGYIDVELVASGHHCSVWQEDDAMQLDCPDLIVDDDLFVETDEASVAYRLSPIPDDGARFGYWEGCSTDQYTGGARLVEDGRVCELFGQYDQGYAILLAERLEDATLVAHFDLSSGL